MSMFDKIMQLLSRNEQRAVLTVTILDRRSDRQAELINLFRDDLETHVRTLPQPGRMRARNVRLAGPECRSH